MQMLWVRLMGTPIHLWSLKSLKTTGDSLSVFQRASSKNLNMEGVLDILVPLDLKSGLLDKIAMGCGEGLCFQDLDYEGIHFKCRFCHIVGCILQDYPQRDIAYKKQRFVGHSLTSPSLSHDVNPKYERTTAATLGEYPHVRFALNLSCVLAL